VRGRNFVDVTDFDGRLDDAIHHERHFCPNQLPTDHYSSDHGHTGRADGRHDLLQSRRPARRR
jgi:hypothetical protein